MSIKKNSRPSQNFTYVEYVSFLKNNNYPLTEKKVEYYLKKNKFFNTVLNFLPGAVYILNYQTGKYIYVSENCESFLGYTSKEFMKMGNSFFIEKFHPDDFAIFSGKVFSRFIEHVKALKPNVLKKSRFSVNYRFKRKDGEYIKLLQQYVVIETTQEGLPLIVLGYCADITAHKHDDRVVFSVSRQDNSKGFTTISTDTFPNPKLQISKREHEVIKCLIQGLSSKQIADKLMISLHTVNAHRRNLLEKTGSKNTAELIQYVIRECLC